MVRRTTEGSYHLGIDENGVGPRLGPLVVTAAFARAADPRPVRRPVRGALRERLGDSKGLVAFGSGGLAEAWARAAMKRASGRAPETPAELLSHLLGAEEENALRRLCPTGAGAQCWNDDHEAFTATQAQVAQAEADLDTFAERGVDVQRVWTIVLCTRRLNLAAQAGESRFLLDLHAIEQLAARARAHTSRPVATLAGKVGGYERYLPHLRMRPLPTGTHESRKESAYRYADGSTLVFAQDADDRYPLVSLASLIGKWVRDLCMHRINRFHAPARAVHEHVSGYHDPVTRAFVEETAQHRAQRSFPHECFERQKAGRLEHAAKKRAPRGDKRQLALLE